MAALVQSLTYWNLDVTQRGEHISRHTGRSLDRQLLRSLRNSTLLKDNSYDHVLQRARQFATLFLEEIPVRQGSARLGDQSSDMIVSPRFTMTRLTFI